MNNAENNRHGDCKHYQSLLENWIDGTLETPEHAAFEAHIRECAECAVRLTRRESVIETLIMAGKDTISAPEELNARAANFGDSETFVKLMMAHLPPIGAPAELDARVLKPGAFAASPPVFVVLKRRRAVRRIVYAAAASITIMVGAGLLYQALDKQQNSMEGLHFTLVSVPREKLSPSILRQVLPLSGLPVENNK